MKTPAPMPATSPQSAPPQLSTSTATSLETLPTKSGKPRSKSPAPASCSPSATYKSGCQSPPDPLAPTSRSWRPQSTSRFTDQQRTSHDVQAFEMLTNHFRQQKCRQRRHHKSHAHQPQRMGQNRPVAALALGKRRQEFRNALAKKHR